MKKNLISEIIISICLFVVGLCMLLWADETINFVTLSFGCIMILYGIFHGIIYLKSEDRSSLDVFYSIIGITLGIILISRPSIVSEIISYVIGIYVLITSIYSLLTTLKYKEDTSKMPLWLSIVGVIIGILCIIGKLLIPSIVLQFIGVMLLIYSIVNIINMIMIYEKIK